VRHLIAALCAAALAVVVASPAQAASRGTLTFSVGCKIDYWRNYALNTPRPSLTQAVIVLHGVSRNAADYARYAETAARAAGTLATTLVLAPRFGEAGQSGYCYWPESSNDLTDWEHGGNDRYRSVSSFQLMDELVLKILADQPTIQRITIVGHSAGAKFVSRYAIATNLELPQLRYVPMNPSTWAYMNDQRPKGSTWGPVTGCSRYDTWRYGLKGISTTYLAAMPLVVRERFVSRPVRVLAGNRDTVADSDMDTTCMGMAQGPNRYARAVNYVRHVDHFWPVNDVELIDVPNVGHSGSGMLRSPQAQKYVFRGSW
jgi:pimeloyl-ACP methyl ester carboxylesterase